MKAEPKSRKASLVLLAVGLVLLATAASVRISQEPVATVPGAGDDLIINTVSGTNYVTKRIAVSNLLGYLPAPLVVTNASTNANSLRIMQQGGITSLVVNAAGFVGIHKPAATGYDLSTTGSISVGNQVQAAGKVFAFYPGCYLDNDGLYSSSTMQIQSTAAGSNILMRGIVQATNGLAFFGNIQTNRGTTAPYTNTYDKIIIGTNANGSGLGGWICLPDRAGLRWADGSYIYGWNDHMFDGQAGAELQIGSPNSLCFYGGANGKLQLGSPLEDNWTLDVCMDGTPTNAAAPLGHSKVLDFQASRYPDPGVDIARPGIVGWAAGTNSNLGTLAFYSRVPKFTYSHWTSATTNLVGLMLTNGWNLRGKLVQERATGLITTTNYTLNLGAAACIDLDLRSSTLITAVNTDNTATNFERRTVILANRSGVERWITWPTNWAWGGASWPASAPGYLTNGQTLIADLRVAGGVVYGDARYYWNGDTNVLTWDADATAYFATAGITNSTEKTAVNTLVTSLKASNLWSKIDYLWPFVGGTSNSCSWSLPGVNGWSCALDFRGPFWFTNGVTCGTNASENYAGTLWYKPSPYPAGTIWTTNAAYTTNSAHFFVYNGLTNTVLGDRYSGVEMNAGASPPLTTLKISNASAESLGLNSMDGDYANLSVGTGLSQGPILLTRTGVSNVVLYCSTAAATNAANGAYQIPTNHFSLFTLRGFTTAGSGANFLGASFGGGLNHAEWLAYSNIWKTFNTTLGR